MEKEIEEKIKTLRQLADSKRRAAANHWCWHERNRLRQEADDLEKGAKKLEEKNKN
jgi:hypothetical protein